MSLFELLVWLYLCAGGVRLSRCLSSFFSFHLSPSVPTGVWLSRWFASFQLSPFICLPNGVWRHSCFLLILPLDLSRLSGCIPRCLVMPNAVRLSGCLSSLVPISLLVSSCIPSCVASWCPVPCVLSRFRLSGCLSVLVSLFRFSNLATALRLLITFLSSLASS